MLQMKEFGEAAGLGFEPRLTDPESVSFTDRRRHGGTGGDKTALLSNSSSLRGTGRDRERHPVAVKLRSSLCSRETQERVQGRGGAPTNAWLRLKNLVDGSRVSRDTFCRELVFIPR